jgi:hypothetical protein
MGSSQLTTCDLFKDHATDFRDSRNSSISRPASARRRRAGLALVRTTTEKGGAYSLPHAPVHVNFCARNSCNLDDPRNDLRYRQDAARRP